MLITYREKLTGDVGEGWLALPSHASPWLSYLLHSEAAALSVGGQDPGKIIDDGLIPVSQLWTSCLDLVGQ